MGGGAGFEGKALYFCWGSVGAGGGDVVVVFFNPVGSWLTFVKMYNFLR